MEVSNLAYHTDLALIPPAGQVVGLGLALQAKTPKNPGFYWGNFLLFPALAASLVQDWPARWVEAFGTGLAHIALGFDEAPPADRLNSLLAQGFVLERAQILTATALEARPVPPGYTVRPLTTDEDWDAALGLQISVWQPRPTPAYVRYKAALMQAHRERVAQGQGIWLGAFAGEALAADLGVFGVGRLARFQNVETHPAHRRRGLCQALLAEAFRWAKGRGAEEAVVVTSEAEALPVYLGAGLKPHSVQWGVFRTDGQAALGARV